MYYTLTAIILARQPLKDDDLLVSVYSAEKGKLILQAKGAKKILSKLAGHLEPLTLSALNVTFGKSIDQLIGAQIINPFKDLKNNLRALGYASYFIELVDSLTSDNHPDKNIFNLLNNSLNYLEHHSNYVLARISFGFKLLYLLGFNPAAKSKLKNQIEYIIKHSLSQLSTNQGLVLTLARLNRFLNQELEANLERELNSTQFLKQLNHV